MQYRYVFVIFYILSKENNNTLNTSTLVFSFVKLKKFFHHINLWYKKYKTFKIKSNRNNFVYVLSIYFHIIFIMKISFLFYQ